MKRILACLIAATALASASEPAPAPAPIPETFDYEWAGTKYTMQKYFIVFLKTGSAPRSEDREQLAALQKAHLDYLGGLYQRGIINLNGPTGGGGEIRGFSVYNVSTQQEAESLAAEDPMVKAGYLTIEVHPWWLAKGSAVK